MQLHANGCDTLVTLRLHIIPTPQGTIEGPIQVYAATNLLTGLYDHFSRATRLTALSIKSLTDCEILSL